MSNLTPSEEATFETEPLSVPRLEVVLKFPPVCVNCLSEVHQDDVGYRYFDEDDAAARTLCQLAVKKNGRIAQMMNDGGLPVLCRYCAPDMSVKALDIALSSVDFKLQFSQENAAELDQILKLALLNICQDKPLLQLRAIELRRLLRYQSAGLSEPGVYWSRQLQAWRPPPHPRHSGSEDREGPE